MKNYLLLAFLLYAGIAIAQQPQDDNESITPWKKTGFQFGVMPAFELSKALYSTSPLTFCPDITIAYNGNVLGIGYRLDGVGYRSADPYTKEYGFGINYLRYFRTLHKSFDFFSYYDFEYFVSSTNQPASPNQPAENYRTVSYNATAGIGYHLNFSQHIYLSNMLAIGVNYLKEPANSFYIGPLDNPIYPQNPSLNVTWLFKVGIGWNF